MDKRSLRRLMRERRSSLPATEREFLSDIIVRKLLSLPIYRCSSTVMAYASMSDEINLRGVFQDCFDAGKSLAIPLIVGQGEMLPVLLPDFDALEIADFGIATVKKDFRKVIDAAKIDCIIVPGMAFDICGNRLGLGGGYYDRFLPRAVNAVKIALAYDFQLVDALPAEPHDSPVDIIITENKLINAERSQIFEEG